jgi:uncharacterized protein (TIGR02246 family)
MADTEDDLTRQATELVAAWGAAWNADDLDAMFALFAPQAHWVNIVGMHWQGREAVERAHRAYFDLMFKGVDQELEEIESVVPLPGGGAVVVARVRMGAFRQPDGVTRPPSSDRLSLVLVPTDDGLRIVHGANVAIHEEAQRFNPVQPIAAVQVTREIRHS